MRIGIFVTSLEATSDLTGQVKMAAAPEKDGFDSFWVPQVSGEARHKRGLGKVRAMEAGWPKRPASLAT